jgi:hypothetical protein
MWIPNKTDCFSIIRSLPFICLCGVLGILPDVDHIAAYSSGIPKDGDFRVWHPTVFLVVGIVMFIVGALSTGLYIRAILKKK